MDWKTVTAAAEMVVDDVSGAVSASPRRKRVAIVGFASSSRHLAPWTDPAYEVWGLNSAYQFFERRPDRWFEVHQGDQRVEAGVSNYFGDLRALGCPVYMTTPDPAVPRSLAYPLTRVQEAAPAPLRAYLTSSMALMIALAVAEEFEEIAVYGVDCTVGSEYEQQKPCIEAWLMYAQGRGITVTVPKESALFKSPFIYGLEKERAWPKVLRANVEFLKRRIATHEAKAEEALHRSLQALGAAQALQDLATALPNLALLQERIAEAQGAQIAQWDLHNQIRGGIMELTALLSFAESTARGATFSEMETNRG